MPRPPKTSRDCFMCCKGCPDRYPACSAHCEKYAAGKAEKERIDFMAGLANTKIV